ncbi:uncharacterized protein I206_101299 [Kwoniella pini CBS 10737]|uniref:TauD/TfdA-like domain-containing protein n=1 Tax=Kwoniella pini CBS 10737 TaxID=1296096 RepID=A0A1B9IAT7_9TREE|nr:uncharacterized protein I206_00024 [Kwoniella pini CBS 10737]OCF52728.1 hypothetical protein I206_00024 [Kwoniella pini CBS 10737]
MTTTVLQSTPSLQQATATLHLSGGEEQIITTDEEKKVNRVPPPNYKYKRFLPTFDRETKYPSLTSFEHKDPGLDALKHDNPREFLQGATINALSPSFGSEVEGIQLSKLDDRGKAQLALYVAQRGVVAFRDQDFIDQDPDWQLNQWGKTFGRLHIHPTSGAPEGIPEFHLVYRDGAPKKGLASYNPNKLSSTGWHSDVTYEEQPPGLTTLFLYDSPSSGGDTGYVSQVEAYKRLSPQFQAFLETLSVLHSGVAQADFSRNGNRGGVVRREPVENIHPLVRRHPVTGEKALFVNKQFSRHIIGLKTEESDAILDLLYTHIAQGHDFQIRAKWKPKTVVLWDNRITAHTAIGDYSPERDGFRHGARITPQAERPFL